MSHRPPTPDASSEYQAFKSSRTNLLEQVAEDRESLVDENGMDLTDDLGDSSFEEFSAFVFLVEINFF